MPKHRPLGLELLLISMRVLFTSIPAALFSTDSCVSKTLSNAVLKTETNKRWIVHAGEI